MVLRFGVGDRFLAILFLSLVIYKLTNFTILLIFLISTLITWIWYEYEQKQYWHKLGVPGPMGNIFFGSLLDVAIKGVAEYDQRNLQKYGHSFGSYLFGRRNFTTMDLEMMRRIFIKDFSHFQNRFGFIDTDNENMQNTVFRNAITMKKNQEWKRIRNRVTPAFTSGKMKKVLPTLNECTNRLCEHIEAEYNAKAKELPLKDVFGRLVLEEIARGGFSLDVNTFKSGEEHIFVQKVKEAFGTKWRQYFLFLLPFCPGLLHFLETYLNYDAFQNSAEPFFRSLLEGLYDQRKADAQAKEKYKDIFQILMNAVDEGAGGDDNATDEPIDADIFHKELQESAQSNKHLTKLELVAQSFVFLVAGYETTGSTLHKKMISSRAALLVVLCYYFPIIFGEVFFKEEFSDESWTNRWLQSKHKDDYGKLELSYGKFFGDKVRDQGLKTAQDARFYAISAKFPKKFTNKGKPLVIQFTIKHEQDIDCGGGYLKLMASDINQEDFHGETPYHVMFGPDICGPGTKKVHVILGYKGKNNLIKKDIRCKDDVLSHLYTLILNQDNTYEVQIDGEKVEGGEFEADWDLLPAKKIKDPDAKKPEDWDDKEYIDDPEDKKPEDWEKPEHIPDPDAKKPDDWDDEMDGEWEPPMIDNPEYKGEWKPKQIKNPNYKGKWIHPEIDNPEYKPDDELYMREDWGAVGIDIWQVKSGTIFDNILVTDSFDEAKAHAAETFEPLREAEKKQKEAADEEERKKFEEGEKKRKEEEEKKEEGGDDDEDGDKEEKEEHDEL